MSKKSAKKENWPFFIALAAVGGIIIVSIVIGLTLKQQNVQPTQAIIAAPTPTIPVLYPNGPRITGTVTSVVENGFFDEIQVYINNVKSINFDTKSVDVEILPKNADGFGKDGQPANYIKNPVQDQPYSFSYSSLDPSATYAISVIGCHAVGNNNNCTYYAVTSNCSGEILQNYCVLNHGGSVALTLNKENGSLVNPPTDMGTIYPTPTPSK